MTWSTRHGETTDSTEDRDGKVVVWEFVRSSLDLACVLHVNVIPLSSSPCAGYRVDTVPVLRVLYYLRLFIYINASVVRVCNCL